MALHIDLSKRVALITGAGAGIGFGIALAMAECGADIMIAEIDPERGSQAVSAIRGLGRRAEFVQTDVMDSGQIQTAVTQTRTNLGALDILVNNAGGTTSRPFLEQSEKSWRRHIEINLLSVLSATSAAASVMISDGRAGSILNVSSIEAARAAPMNAVYAACKAAVASFTRSMALELSEYGIRVNAIAPDLTHTPGTSGLRQGPVPTNLPPRDPETDSAIRAYVPLGREGSIEDCGQLAAFLASPLASYVTGVCIPVDGGSWASGGWLRGHDDGWTIFGTTRPARGFGSDMSG
jgi:NAD(P)-dependent dehydrogenase (short-subunit alcohol dehydrogenase family)